MLYDNNFENNLNVIITDTKIEVNQLKNRFVYSDINDRRQNSILKFLFIINKIKLAIILAKNTAIPIITYYSKRYLIFL